MQRKIEDLTVQNLLEVATALRSLDPQKVASFRIDGGDRTISGQSVIVPDLANPTTFAVLAVFQGKARIGEAPTTPGTTIPPTTVPGASTTTTIPEVVIEYNTVGVVPPNDPSCR